MYNEIIFADFESAKKARRLVYNALKSRDTDFVSIGDLQNDLFDHNDIVWKKRVLTWRRCRDIMYGWKKKGHLAIYEYENGNPDAGYIFEDPVFCIA